MKKLPLILFVFLAAALSLQAQDTQNDPFDASKVPDSTADLQSYAQSGWKVEEIVKGDLNGDGKPDAAVKLAQIEKDREGGIGGSRVLVIAFAEGGGWKRAAFADKILQCVDCGGAFYGVMPAPAGVTIEKGVLVIENEHGSRDVSKSTFRFRLIPGIGRFSLIGYDYTDNDRLTGEWTSESTNYSTMVRITKTGKGKRTTTKRSKITPTTIYLEDADGEELEGKALHRLGLD
jgi:hypothetical protein